MIKVILISDYLLTREVYSDALQRNGEIEFVGNFDNLNDGIDFIYKHSVDVILVDIRLSDCQLEAVSRLKQRYRELKVLFMTEPEETDLIIKIFALGAAYVLKNLMLNEFMNVIITTIIGIVKCEDDVTKEIKWYIGDGGGVDENTDAEFIHQFGARLFPNMSIFKNE